MGGGLHDRPAVGGRVHGLPGAELLRGHPRPALRGHGPEALPAHARHGHGPVLDTHRPLCGLVQGLVHSGLMTIHELYKLKIYANNKHIVLGSSLGSPSSVE